MEKDKNVISVKCKNNNKRLKKQNDNVPQKKQRSTRSFENRKLQRFVRGLPHVDATLAEEKLIEKDGNIAAATRDLIALNEKEFMTQHNIGEWSEEFIVHPSFSLNEVYGLNNLFYKFYNNNK